MAFPWARLATSLLLLSAPLAAGCTLSGCNHGSGDRPPAMTGVGVPTRFARTGQSEDLLCALAPEQQAETPSWLADSPPACECGRESPACRHVEVGNDRRRALLVSPETTLRATIPSSGAASFRFAIAVLARHPQRLTVRMEVFGSDGDGPQSWEREIHLVDGWVNGAIDLSSLHGEERTVVAHVGGGAHAAPDWAVAIANPRFVVPTETRTGTPSNVIVYLIDTLRFDRLSAYGYERPTSPRLEAVARSGITFENVHTTAAITRPATASLLTSLYPSFHLAQTETGLPSEVTTIAERFRHGGWSTWAFVTNGHIYGKSLNFEQGFDRFVAIPGAKLNGHARTEELNALLLPHLAAAGDEPFFLYVHTVDPHSPYDPPEDHRGRFTDPGYRGGIEPSQTSAANLTSRRLSAADVAFVRDLYDEEIRYQDDMLGVLLDWMSEHGLDRNTVLVVVADHGEMLFERGLWGHGHHLFEELTHIPLLMRVPGWESLAGRRVRASAQIVDVMPTLLRWFGLDARACQGKDLTPLILDSSRHGRRQIYCEESHPDEGYEFRSLTDGAWKIIQVRAAGRPAAEELFNLAQDPGERNDLAKLASARLVRMERRLAEQPIRLGARVKPATSAPMQHLDESTRRKLEALGYVMGGSPSQDHPPTDPGRTP